MNIIFRGFKLIADSHKINLAEPKTNETMALVRSFSSQCLCVLLARLVCTCNLLERIVLGHLSGKPELPGSPFHPLLEVAHCQCFPYMGGWSPRPSVSRWTKFNVYHHLSFSTRCWFQDSSAETKLWGCSRFLYKMAGAVGLSVSMGLNLNVVCWIHTCRTGGYKGPTVSSIPVFLRWWIRLGLLTWSRTLLSFFSFLVISCCPTLELERQKEERVPLCILTKIVSHISNQVELVTVSFMI